MVGASARKAAEINRTRAVGCRPAAEVFRKAADNFRTTAEYFRLAADNCRTAAEVCRAGICPPGYGNIPPDSAFSSPPAANGDLSPIQLQR